MFGEKYVHKYVCTEGSQTHCGWMLVDTYIGMYLRSRYIRM